MDEDPPCTPHPIPGARWGPPLLVSLLGSREVGDMGLSLVAEGSDIMDVCVPGPVPRAE